MFVFIFPLVESHLVFVCLLWLALFQEIISGYRHAGLRATVGVFGDGACRTVWPHIFWRQISPYINKNDKKQYAQKRNAKAAR